MRTLMRTLSVALTALMITPCAHQAFGAEAPPPAELIAQARHLASSIGDEVWPGLAATRSRVLLVDGDREVLLCSESPPPPDFESAGRDDATGCPRFERPRQFDAGFLAAFPLSDGVPTIVIGTPQATRLSPVDWIVTLVHERFHQFQYASPEYSSNVAALELDGGDRTGMWMLNYPFPYEDPAVRSRFGEVARRAAAALLSRGTEQFQSALARYLAARNELASTLSASDLRYLDFQAWQEGTARYVEKRTAMLWEGHPATADSVARELVAELHGVDLAVERRVAFYPLGAAEAFLLDEIDASWKQTYLSPPLALSPRLAHASSP